MYHDLVLWNDEPVVEKGRWRMLVPNNYAKKYKNVRHPVVVHRCPMDELKRDYVMTVKQMKEKPQCGVCGELCPDDVQGLYVLHQFDEMG